MELQSQTLEQTCLPLQYRTAYLNMFLWMDSFFYEWIWKEGNPFLLHFMQMQLIIYTVSFKQSHT